MSLVAHQIIFIAFIASSMPGFAFPSECLQLVYSLSVFCLHLLLRWKKPEMGVLVIFVLSEHSVHLCLCFLLGIS